MSRIAFLDVETTGRTRDTRKLLEVAIIVRDLDWSKPKKNAYRDVYYRRFNPGCDIPAWSTAIHGITNEDVEHEPEFDEDEASYIAKTLERVDIIVGHGVQSDRGVLRDELDRVLNIFPGEDEFSTACDFLHSKVWWCTRRLSDYRKRCDPDFHATDTSLARQLKKIRHLPKEEWALPQMNRVMRDALRLSLGNVAEWLGYELTDGHRLHNARSDVHLTEAVFDNYRKWFLSRPWSFSPATSYKATAKERKKREEDYLFDRFHDVAHIKSGR